VQHNRVPGPAVGVSFMVRDSDQCNPEQRISQRTGILGLEAYREHRSREPDLAMTPHQPGTFSQFKGLHMLESGADERFEPLTCRLPATAQLPRHGAFAHRSLVIAGSHISTKGLPGSPGPSRVASYLTMGAFDQLVKGLQSYEPIPPVWRMRCLCSFRAGRVGEIAACECRSWWRAGKRGRWYAISKLRAFRALLPELMRGLSYFEVTGRWPTDAA